MGQQRECVILVGIQGSGKSTFCARNFYDSHVRINLDMLRTRPREKKIFEGCLGASQSCVIDNTNTTLEERERYIEAAKKNRFRVICYYFEPNLKESIKRNEKRDVNKRVPTSAIVGRMNTLQPPSKEEGIDELHRVSAVNGDFLIEDYTGCDPEKKVAPQVITRNLSIAVSEKIDWNSIIRSLAWDMNIGVEIKDSPSTINRPLVLLELVGYEKSIIEFSKMAQEKISESINNIPTIEVVRGFYTIPRWSTKSKETKKLAVNMGLKLDILSVDKGWLTKTVFYEAEGRSESIKEFVETTSPKAFS